MMQVAHKSLAPVLLLGHPSSGTSILAKLLRKHLRISFGTESQFILRYHRKLHWYGDLADDGNLRRLLNDLVRERWFERCQLNFGFQTNPERLFAGVRERTYGGVLASVFGELARHSEMERWGDKSPNDTYALPLMREMFPQAKFLHIVRDGRDVALSLFGRPFGRKNIYLAAREWRDLIDYIVAFSKSLPGEQFLEIRYEDLLANPVETFARLIAFLEIDDRDGELMSRLAEHLPHELRQTNYNKWKSRFTKRQRQRFERIAGHVLDRYGYETQFCQSVARDWRLERVFWLFHDRLRKYSFPGYWRDNLYKTNLRIRGVAQFLRSIVRQSGVPARLSTPSRNK